MLRYAIVGAAGQVGQEFCKCLPAERLTALTRQQIDITDPRSVSDALAGVEYDVLVNLAAFHDVNGCEDDGVKAFQVNGLGAYHLARAASGKRRKVVFFSSDYVFGAQTDRRTPYLERDAVGPINVYGASKVAGEHLVRSACDDHLIVRASSLFGVVTSKKGWTFPEMILRRAKAGEPLRVVHDQYMSPTYTLDLVKAVIALAEAGATGTVHVANGEGCTWYEFAKATLELAGVAHPIEPVRSDAFPAKARRPVYSRMDSERIESFGVPAMRHWRDALAAYLVEKGAVTG
ncbi:MAG: dTDP-4-dehydrorhamnose reductase [Planctomycetes bacterium]|nr:dTDP-4-dehydrorhamnose reductase [Planctomycetota bacterium]